MFNSIVCDGCLLREYDEYGEIITSCHYIREENIDRVHSDLWFDNKEIPENYYDDYIF